MDPRNQEDPKFFQGTVFAEYHSDIDVLEFRDEILEGSDSYHHDTFEDDS